MPLSVFDLFSIGIGPSSSHTVGPMKAAYMFAESVQEDAANLAHIKIRRIKVELYGSLGATGRAHGSEKAVLLGLEGEQPHKFDPSHTQARLDLIKEKQQLRLLGKDPISINPRKDLVFWQKKSLPYHSNGMVFSAYDDQEKLLLQKTYYSVGGGFVIDDKAIGAERIKEDDRALPYPFHSAAELIAGCEQNDLCISQLMMANERTWQNEKEIRENLLKIWAVMQSCVQAGIENDGFLPGGLKVRRRAKKIYQDLQKKSQVDMISPGLSDMDWVNVYAIAVNEENAAGGRVVTAPTNGAAGIVPAVMHYYTRCCRGASEDGIVNFLLVAGAIAILYKENASISGAEVGCQGEVGSACSMAAGALTEVMGGSIYQVENAAEIAMEHNLGLTCDPIGGLVQVPCIERNAMGAVKAINAARMALRSDGTHFVSLDKVIKTMRATGEDMKDKYKETARGGLAVNVIEC